MKLAAYASLPLSFERNEGQARTDVRFLARAPGFAVLLKASEAMFVPGARRGTPGAVRMRLVGASGRARMTGVELLPGTASYLVGPDRTHWRTNVSTYRKVRYEAIYPGIDLECYGNPRRLELDFIVAAGADPRRIELELDGGGSLRIGADGDLVIGGDASPLRLTRPRIYQEIDRARRHVDGHYVLRGKQIVGFEIGAYDRRHPLVIDPVVIYSTYLPGTGNDQVADIAVDTAGNAYVVGTTTSPEDSTWHPLPQYPRGNADVFVAKLNATGTALVYSVLFGGSGLDSGQAVAVDAQGHAYVTGYTQSPNFPAVRAIQPSMGNPFQDSFISKLNPTGTDFEFSTYFGGQGGGRTTAIALDDASNVYVVGVGTIPESSSLFGSGNGFVAKLASNGEVLLYATRLGGTGLQQALAVAVDPNRSVYVAGITSATDFPTQNAVQPTLAGDTDGFVTKLTSLVDASSMLSDGFEGENGGMTALDYATFDSWTVASGTADLLAGDSPDFLPGSGSYTRLGGVAAIPSRLESRQQYRLSPQESTFPAANPSFYRLQLSLGSAPAGPSGAGPVVTVRVGTVFAETFRIADNAPRSAILREFAATTQTDARVSIELESGDAAALIDDVSLSRLVERPSISYSTYLGGVLADAATAIAADEAGFAYVAGSTASAGFPTVGARQAQFGGGLSDAFVTKLDPVGTAIAYSSFVGGSGEDVAHGIARDLEGNLYLAGATASADFPTANAVQPQLAGVQNGFVTKLTPVFELAYSTYLGGSTADVVHALAVDAQGNAYVGGQSSSADFPTEGALFPAAAGGADGFVAKLLDAADVRLIGLTPTRGGNAGTVTMTIRGSNLPLGTVSVELVAHAREDIAAISAAVTDATRVRATFDLQGEPPGTRDVVVAFADGSSIALPGAFTVEPGGAANLWIDVVGRTLVRAGVPSAYYVTFGNDGNVDSPDALLWIATPLGVSVNPAVPYLEGLGPSPNDPPVFVDGSAYTWFYTSTIAAGESRSLTVRLSLAVPQVDVRAGIVPADVAFAGLDPESASLRFALSMPPPSWTPSTAVSASQSDGPRPGDIVFRLSGLLEWPTGHVGIYVGEMTDESGAALPCSPDCVVDMVPEPEQLRARSLTDWAPGGTYLGAFRPPGATAPEAAAAVEYATLIFRNRDSWPPYLIPPVAGWEDCVSFLNDCYRAAGFNPRWPDLASPPLAYEVVAHRPWPDPRISVPFNIARLMSGFTPIAAGSPVWALLLGRPLLHVQAVQSLDPNEKAGSQGSGPDRFVASGQPLRYAVFFENVDTATAAARDVSITDLLDTATLDVTTVALGPIVFGNRQVVPPAGLSDFSTVVDLRPEYPLSVRVVARLDTESGLLQWTFTSLDPATGLPPDDPSAGFLPPNVHPPEGDGAVFLTVMPRSDQATGTVIENRASIIFDANAPIETDPWLNRLDATPPSSRVGPLPSPQCGPTIMVEWSGEDEGAGVLDYTIYVSDNEGPFEPWLTHTAESGGVFTGTYGHRYSFFSTGRDRTGNLEEASSEGDALVALLDATPPELVCSADLSLPATTPAGAPATFTVTSTDNCGPASITCSPASGSTFAIGTAVVECSASDAAGNAGSCHFTVHVEGAAEQIDRLMSTIRGAHLHPGIENSLLAKLNSALSAIDTPAACGPLGAFVNEVSAQAGKKIPATLAAGFIDTAKRIKRVTGCS